MKMREVIIVCGLLLVGCSDEPASISKFEMAWEASVSDLANSPLQVVSTNSNSDGSFIVVYGFVTGQQYLFVKFSADGKTRTTFLTPSGNYMAGLNSMPDGGYNVVLNPVDNQNSFTRLRVDSNLQVQQQSFQINRPATFHILNFSTENYFLSVFESPFPGIRVRQFSYDNVAGWNQRFTQPHIKPFPDLLGDNLIFFRTNSMDSVGISAVAGSTGTLRWTTSYVPGALEGRLTGQRMFLAFTKNGFLFLSDFNTDRQELTSAVVNPLDGSVTDEYLVAMPDDLNSADPFARLPDNGLLIGCISNSSTSILSTDKQGNIGWRGDFAANANAFLSADQKLLVAEPTKVYLLNLVVANK